MARQKNWSYNSYDENEDISVIGNYIWDSNSLSWIKQTAAAAGGGGPVSIADGADTAEGSTTDVAWVSGAGTVISLLKTIASTGASSGLTDAQLRAVAVPVSGTFFQGTQPVSGPLTDAQLRVTPVPVSGTVNVGTVPVTGPLTDAQLRVTPVPVSGTVTATGPLTDAQLRAAAVVVDNAELPAAAALSDTAGNPTTTLVGACNMVWDGAVWQRQLDNGFGVEVHLGGTVNEVLATQGAFAGTAFAWDMVLNNSGRTAKLITTGDRLHVDGSGVTQPVSGAVTAGITSIDGEGTIATAQVSVGVAAATVVAARAGRRSLLIVNHGTTDVFLGPATVTVANGILLPGVKGASISIPTTALVQGIVASGTQTVSYIEVF